MSTGVPFASISSSMATTSSWLASSAWTEYTWTPIARNSCSICRVCSSLRLCRIKLHPCSAINLAVWSPTPRLAPVMSAHLPFTLTIPISSLFAILLGWCPNESHFTRLVSGLPSFGLKFDCSEMELYNEHHM
ncbi:hypothetical protein D3C76_1220640 [compost metagenome]